MQSFYYRCIFCGNELTPAEARGRGDHVIPEFMYGSLCMKDVCTSCNCTLGSTADCLAIEDARIISTVLRLDLPELRERIIARGRSKIVDTDTGSESKVIFKNGRPRVVSRPVSDKSFVSDERDGPTHLLNRLQKSSENGVSSNDLRRIVYDELWPKCQALEPGGSIHNSRLGMTLRKARGRIEHEFKVTDGAAKRLVAKIGYETAFLMFDRQRIEELPILDQLRSMAMGNGDVDPDVLVYPPLPYSPVTPPPHSPQYQHQMVVYYEENYNIMDIYLFGVVGYRFLLASSSAVAHGPVPHPDGDIRMASILMTFEPGYPKSKYMFVQRCGQENIEKYCGARIL